MASAAERKTIYLVDGSSYIFRAFHALPPMTRPDGTPVNAVYGFTNMLTKLVDDTGAEYMAVLFDSARKTFRNEVYAEYKAHRPPPPEDLVPQFALIREATEACNLPSLEMPGFEADDLIATLARMAVEREFDVTIVSSDKDLMQLVGAGVRMLDPMKNRVVGPQEVVERFGVDPGKVIDVQALAGDSTDNVPGVPGIGVKTAAQLIGEYGDLDALLARAEEIRQPKRRQALVDNAELARISRELVTLRDDVPVACGIEDFRLAPPDPGVLLPFLETQNFRSMLDKFRAALGDSAGPRNETGAPGDVPYELVQDRRSLEAWIEDIDREGVVAIDTETTSLDPMRAELVGLSMSLEDGRTCYVPVGHVAPGAADSPELNLGEDGSPGGAPRQIPLREALDLLKPVLEDPGVLKIGHNVKYDVHVLARYGVDTAPVDDTMLLSYVLDGGLHNHGLDDLALRHFDHVNIKYSDVTGKGRNRIGFAEVPLDKALDYAAEDADVARRLHGRFRRRLVEERMVTVYETLERPLLPVLADMERAGIVVDAVALNDLSSEFESRAAEIAEDIYEEAGRSFNIGSPKQLGEVLFEELGLQGGKKTKTGAYATGADILEELAMNGHELPLKIMNWRQLTKLKGTYTDALVKEIDPTTGRVHTSYSQAVASTGRLSSNDPNLQNIPVRTREGREIRKAFVAGAGCVLLSADYSQIELRLLAHVAGIDALRQAFHDGADIHAMTASEVFGVPVDGMPPEERNRAKAINFGIIYGISAYGLARQLLVPRERARDYIDSYFRKFPGIKDYMDRTIESAGKRGFVETIFGRRCHTPGILDKNQAKRRFSERAAINAPLQGAAADIIKRAMIRIPPALAEVGLRAKMLLQVHDELIFETPEDELEDTAALVKGVMENAAHLDVPLVVQTGDGANWREAH